MKVKIEKGKKTKNYKLISSWSEVTLEKWLKIVDLQEAGASEEALGTISELSNIPKKLVKELSIGDVSAIMDRVGRLQHQANSSLKRIIEIEGVEYGFHPSLDRISLGEFADLETFLKMGIQKHLPEVMAILYRPIVEKKNDIYTIEKYDGNIEIRTEIMKKMPAEQVESALVFFWSFVKELLIALPSSLIKRLKETRERLQAKVLQKNGDGSE
tara:strand:- start:13067 stop:13708 length:642 start_codon:yes stop_codon:yes gene_type:complete